MKIKFKVDQIPKIVKQYLIPKLKECRIITFSGPLGAGKTTIIQELLKTCGVKDVITSPTFNYVNTYKTDDGKIFNHFDLYRMPDLESFLNSGFDEYFYNDSRGKESWNLIEWPEIINPLLQNSDLNKFVCNIYLNYDKDDFNHRIIEI